jgi:hypothetical protein
MVPGPGKSSGQDNDFFFYYIMIFPFISSNIPASSACGFYISQLICYSRACASYRTPTVLFIYSSSVKVLAVIEERNHLRKK